MNIYFLMAFTLKQPDKKSAIIRSKIDALRGLPKFFIKRYSVQKMRKVPWWKIHSAMNRNPLAPRWISRHRDQWQKNAK
jgi:hypothetical protein